MIFVRYCLPRGLILSLACVLTTTWAEPTETASAEPAHARPVLIYRAGWHDDTRDRDVPVKIFYPADLATPAPVILFSPGLGGSREGYAYLGNAWAAQGYISVHLQHPGSDDAVWHHTVRKLKALRQAAANPAVINDRPLDVRFTLDRLATLAADPAFVLHNLLDLDQVGLAGHSFGAFTTMAVAGRAYSRASAPLAQWHDPRVKAAIAMSIPVPARPGQSPNADGYDAVRIPVFHLTGTADTDVIGTGSDPAWRRLPYDHTTHAPAWLLVLKGGDHRVFGGPASEDDGARQRLMRNRDEERDHAFHLLIQQATTRFWDAELRHDAAALAWLNDGGLAAAAGSLAQVEGKSP